MTTPSRARNQRNYGWLIPAPFCMDPRSLALFRILLAVYLAQDLVGRFRNGLASLSWYISKPSAFNDYLPPIFHAKDVLHKQDSLLASIWCWRGTPEHQVILMTVHALCILLYGLGWNGFSVVPFLLWLSTTSLVCRSPEVNFNDLGDTMGHIYLFWSLFLPHLGDLGRMCFRRSYEKQTTQIESSTPNKEDIATLPEPEPLPVPSKTATDDTSLRQRRRVTKATTQQDIFPRTDDDVMDDKLKSPATMAHVYRYKPVCGLHAFAISLQVVIIYIAIMLGRRRERAWWVSDFSNNVATCDF